MSRIKQVFIYVIVVLLLSGVAWLLRTTDPSSSGVFAGMAVFSVVMIYVTAKYGHLPLKNVIPREKILRLGVWPLILFLSTTLLFIERLAVSQSFLSTFLVTIVFMGSFFLFILTLMSKQSGADEEKGTSRKG